MFKVIRFQPLKNFPYFQNGKDANNSLYYERFISISFITSRGEEAVLKTDVAEPTHNPVWNATLEFSNVQADSLMDRTMEVTLWDACPGPERETFFLG